MRKKSHFITSKKFILATTIVVILGLGGAFYYFTQARNDNVVGGIDYGPPTKEEANAGNRQKEVIEEREKSLEEQQNNQNNKTANVIITGTGQYGNTIEVRAFIQNHYEDGTCTITLTKDSQTVSKSTPAYKDATTTICTNPEFQRSEFNSGGEWQVKVNYTSNGASGTSKSNTITIE